MANAYIGVTQGTGVNLQTYRNTVGGNIVDSEALTLTDSSGAEKGIIANPVVSEITDGTNILFTSGNPGYVQGTIVANNGSVSATGSSVPADATYFGFNSGGNLVGASSANPLPVTAVITSPVDGSGYVEVDLMTSIPAGSNLIGMVEVSDGTNVLFTSAHPGYVQGTVSIGSGPFSVNLTEVGGSSFALGQQLAAGAIPVVLTAIQVTSLTPPSASAIASAIVANPPTVPATQSGTWTVGISAAQTIAVTNAGTFAVQVSSALPAGSNIIGQVEVSDGTNVLFTSTHPGYVQGTVTFPATPTVYIEGHAGATLDAAPGAAIPTNALFIGGSDGTDIRAILTDTSGVLQDNIKNWGGTAVSAPPASGTPPAGTEVAPVVKPIQRKSGSVLTTTPLAANAVFTGSWIDTNTTGGHFVSVSAFANQASATNGFVIQESDDSSNSSFTRIARQQSVTASTFVTADAVIKSRYWRVVYTNGGTLQTTFELAATESTNIPYIVIAGINSNGETVPSTIVAGNTATNGVISSTIPVAPGGSAVGTDGSLSVTELATQAGASALLGSVPYLVTGPAGNPPTVGAQRTPSVFQGALCNAGATVVWYPTVGKKVRLMRYKIEVGEDCSYASTNTPVMLSFDQGIPTTTGGTFGPQPTYMHRVQIPTTALATAGALWDSDWVDIGNGYLASNASVPLLFGLSTAQAASSITPTFTISTSEQWEAGTIGFKSTGNLGGAVLRQQTNIGTSGVLPAISVLPGNTLIVVARVTNSATGTSVLSASDTASNTYTALAAISNSSDGTHGSQLYILYSIGIKGNASNITTVAGTNSPTLIQAMILEYQGITAVGSTGQASATGSSTAPSSGAYTPGEVGDLLITCFATASNGAALTSQPTVATFTMRGTIFLSTGALCVADNFGNGTLAAGGINVVVVGTEE